MILSRFDRFAFEDTAADVGAAMLRRRPDEIEARSFPPPRSPAAPLFYRAPLRAAM
jgi:hypothetical protein